MNATSLIIPTPPHFSFWSTVYSHGWSDLRPFEIDKELETLNLTLRLSPKRFASLTLSPLQRGIQTTVIASALLSSDDKWKIRSVVADCFRLNEELEPFYTIAKKVPSFRWALKKGAGRMIRSASVFEDVVKMICTTNCSWSLTKSMTSNLVIGLGEDWNGTRTFPTPEALARVSEKFVRKEIRAGYRSPFLLEFAERVATGALEVESWRTAPLTTEELFKRLRGIKGVGEYAAGNLLRLLGHYDAMAFDSWVRAEYYKKHRQGRRVLDRTIEKHYAPYGPWRGLFFWLDMTESWFEKRHPF